MAGTIRFGEKVGVYVVRSFILLSFLFLGLGFYELSGGSEFEPEARPSAAAAVVETTPLISQDIVSRDDTDTVAGLDSLPAALTQPLIAAAPEPVSDPVTEAAEQAVADAIAAALAAPAPQVAEQVTEQATLVSLASPVGDQRYVDATSLNVRAGPSISDRVMARLDQNAPVIVLSELADGWALVRIGEAGTEGWVAARFLTQ